jgi:RNA polymerase sigma-70 factor (ECF subfamily)
LRFGWRSKKSLKRRSDRWRRFFWRIHSSIENGMAIHPSELAQLWHASSGALTMLARARCRSPDDCVQEAFIRLANQAEVPREPIAWLSKVVRNEAISQWRSESRRTRREEIAVEVRQQWFASQACSAFDPIDLMAVADALRGLDVDDREIVIAHVWTGLSFRQIADSFELSLAMVHRRYHAALEQLRAKFDRSEPSIQVSPPEEHCSSECKLEEHCSSECTGAQNHE